MSVQNNGAAFLLHYLSNLRMLLVTRQSLDRQILSLIRSYKYIHFCITTISPDLPPIVMFQVNYLKDMAKHCNVQGFKIFLQIDTLCFGWAKKSNKQNDSSNQDDKCTMAKNSYVVA